MTTVHAPVFVSTPLYAAMNSGKYLWGDLILDMEAAGALKYRCDPADRPKSPEPDWWMEFPTLTRREHIWNNFPYDVVPLGRGADSADRYAIRLNRTKFDDWRNTRTLDFDEAMDYADITEYRLMKCLTASTYWTVEEPITDKDLCVIRMNFTPRTTDAPAEAPTPTETTAPAVAPTATEAVAVAEDDSVDEWVVAGPAKKVTAPPAYVPKAGAVPLIASKQPLNELRTHFPVCWNKETDVATRTAVYSLAIHGTNLRAMARAAGVDERTYRATVEVRLMATLKASPAWRVLRAEKPTEYCRLEMA